MNGGCSSMVRASGCEPECWGFESPQPPQMKVKNTMNKERLTIPNNLLQRLLESRVFAWNLKTSITINDYLFNSARKRSKDRIVTLEQDLTVSPKTAIQKVKPRAETWQYAKLLDHTLLKRIFRLSYFFNL